VIFMDRRVNVFIIQVIQYTESQNNNYQFGLR
jgi:hypothetical protein